jgi:hypothetical protein
MESQVPRKLDTKMPKATNTLNCNRSISPVSIIAYRTLVG